MTETEEKLRRENKFLRAFIQDMFTAFHEHRFDFPKLDINLQTYKGVYNVFAEIEDIDVIGD